MQVSVQIFAISVFACLVPLFRTLTPPRIIYGGWTPIVPGHPYYFGPVQHFERPHYQHVHYGDPSLTHSPEHQVEHHVEYVSPQQYQTYEKPDTSPVQYQPHTGPVQYQSYKPHDSPEQYQSYKPHDSPEQYQSYDNPHANPVQYQSYDKPNVSPVHHQPHSNPVHYQSHEKPQADPVHYQSHEKPQANPVHYQSYEKPHANPVHYQSYEKPHANPVHFQSHDKPSASPVHYQPYNKPETGPVQYQSYGKPKEVEHHIEYVSPVKHQSYEKPKGEYHPPTHQVSPPDHEHIKYGHKPGKDIFSYYPPHSAYDEPKGHGHDYKPVYFEIPKKPLDIFHNADLASLKDLPIDLKSIYPVSGKASLKMKPLNLNALKQIGHINAGQLHHLVPDMKYPVLKDSSGGVPIKPAFLSLGYKNYAPIHAPFVVGHLPKSHVNAYKGSAIQQDEYLQMKRPLTPIETKYTRNANLLAPPLKSNFRVPRLRGYKHLNLPVLHPAHPYSALRHVHLLKPQVSYRPVVGSKNIHPSLKSYLSAGAPSYHTLRAADPMKSAYTSLHHPANKPSLVKNYLHKDVKLHSLYQNPAYVANVRGSPAIVEREVAIIHVPVEDGKAYPDNEYLFHTASTPESTQILDASRLNRSLLSQHHPQTLNNNESYTHITLDYGKGVEHLTLVEPTVASQIDPPSEAGSSSDRERFIYVSSNGVRGTDVQNGVDHQEAQKQFFHAYYGPADHVPPPGYVRMTVPEFNRLFSNAEIRYVDRGDLETQQSAKREDRKPADSKS